MGVEIVIIFGIIAGASAFTSLVSAGTSLGTLFYFKEKFKSLEKFESKDTTNIKIKNKAEKEEHPDGTIRFTREQDIDISDIDIDIGSKLVDSSTSVTRTGFPNKVAETLAEGASDTLKSIGADATTISSNIGHMMLGKGLKLVETNHEIDLVKPKARNVTEPNPSPDDIINSTSMEDFVEMTGEANTMDGA